jgi:hypothetical protein
MRACSPEKTLQEVHRSIHIVNFLHLSKASSKKLKRIVRRSSVLGPTISARCFRPPSYLLPSFTLCRATGDADKDCLTPNTVVSNSNEDSEQGQTKVHGEDTKGAAGEDEKSGLRQDAVGSQVIDVLEAQEIKGVSLVPHRAGRNLHPPKSRSPAFRGALLRQWIGEAVTVGAQSGEHLRSTPCGACTCNHQTQRTPGCADEQPPRLHDGSTGLR